MDSDLAADVLTLFEATCTKCHGPQVIKPKGKFGYVTDLARVAANPDFVVPAQPDDSELFLLLLNGEMPPPKSDVPTLTEADVQLVRLWIEAGAPAGAAPPGVSTPSTTDTDPPAARQGDKSISWRQWLGRFHPASAHLPIGLILGAALAEFLVILGVRASLRTAARFCLVVGAAGAVGSVVLGWWNAEAPSFVLPSNEWLAIHRWVGVSTAGVSIAAVVFSSLEAVRSTRGVLVAYRIALFVAALLVSAGGFLGGVMLYGIDHYSF